MRASGFQPGTGDVALEFRRPWSDGTTHLVFAPVAFLARLAVLVPRSRVNLVLHYGVLAPRARVEGGGGAHPVAGGHRITRVRNPPG